MPASLLQSQFDTLEAPGADECVYSANVEQAPSLLVAQLLHRLRAPIA